MVFHWSLSNSKSPQVSGTLLSILSVLNNAVIWIVSTRLPTSKSSRPFNNPLVTVPRAPITIGTIVTFMFHSFFNSLARSRYLSFFHNLSVLFCGQPGQYYYYRPVFHSCLSDNHSNRIKKWYLMPPCLTLCIIRYISRVKAEQSRERSSALPFTSL